MEGPTPEEMVRRASRRLACQDECERLGTLPEATRRAFEEAGFYRILQPRRFGGYELGLDAYARLHFGLPPASPMRDVMMAIGLS